MESKAHLHKLTPMITNYLIPLICRLRHEVPIRLQSYIHTKLLEGSPLAKDIFLEEHTIEQSDLLFNTLHIKYMIVQRLLRRALYLLAGLKLFPLLNRDTLAWKTFNP